MASPSHQSYSNYLTKFLKIKSSWFSQPFPVLFFSLVAVLDTLYVLFKYHLNVDSNFLTVLFSVLVPSF